MDPISLLLGVGGKIIDKVWPDPEKKAEAQAKLMEMAQRGELQAEANQVTTLVAEMQGNWLQKSWRPLLMLMFGFIIANNYIISPYLQALFGFSVALDIPPDMWRLLNIGIGGYVIGRSGEKLIPQVAKALKGR